MFSGHCLRNGLKGVNCPFRQSIAGKLSKQELVKLFVSPKRVFDSMEGSTICSLTNISKYHHTPTEVLDAERQKMTTSMVVMSCQLRFKIQAVNSQKIEKHYEHRLKLCYALNLLINFDCSIFLTEN